MSDTAALAAVLAALYACECVVWVPAGSLCIYTRLGRRHRLADPADLVGSARGGLLLLSPLPAPGRAFLVAEPAPGDVGDLDLAALGARLAAHEAAARPVRLAATALFLLVAAVGPLLVWRLGLAATWPHLAALLLALVAATVATWVRAHRRLYPDARGERRSRAAVMAVSPLTAMRAPDELSRRLLAGYDPVAAALALCPPETAAALARRRLLDARQDAAGDPAGGHERLVRAFSGAGLPPELLLAAPRRESPAARAYCPRCHTQFAVANARCEACGDRALEPFREPPSAAL